MWFEKGNARVSDLSWAIGPGLSVRTPVGPIRFELSHRAGRPTVSAEDLLEFVNAGHPPAYRLGGEGGVSALDAPPGLPLGAMDDYTHIPHHFSQLNVSATRLNIC